MPRPRHPPAPRAPPRDSWSGTRWAYSSPAAARSARAAAARSMSNPVARAGAGAASGADAGMRVDRGGGDDRRGGPARGIQRHPHDAAVAPAAGDQRAAVGRDGDVADRFAGLDRCAQGGRRTRRPSAGTPERCRRPRAPRRPPRASGGTRARTASRRWRRRRRAKPSDPPASGSSAAPARRTPTPGRRSAHVGGVAAEPEPHRSVPSGQ